MQGSHASQPFKGTSYLLAWLDPWACLIVSSASRMQFVAPISLSNSMCLLCGNAGLPGVLDRQESRLQLELAVIQRRLARVAQLQDGPQPRTPRLALASHPASSGWPYRCDKGHCLFMPRHNACPLMLVASGHGRAPLCASGWISRSVCGWLLTAVNCTPHSFSHNMFVQGPPGSCI